MKASAAEVVAKVNFKLSKPNGQLEDPSITS